MYKDLLVFTLLLMVFSYMIKKFMMGQISVFVYILCWHLTMYVLVYSVISLCLYILMNVISVNQHYRGILKSAHVTMFCFVAVAYTTYKMQTAFCVYDARYTECDAIT